MHRFEGLIAASHTPMRDDGAIALEVVPLQARLHREQGNVGVFVCGSTGEGHSLSKEERRSISEAWSAVTDPELPLIVHVGCNALPDACDLAAHAASLGAAAISCQAPCYEKPRTVEDLVSFLAKVASSAPETPFYYYDIPSFTNVRFPITEVMHEAGRRIPTLQGVKFTAVDDAAQEACIMLDGGRHEVLHGCDERLLEGLELGCSAAVGSTYNYAAPIYRNVIDLLEIGDRIGARAAQDESVRLVEALLGPGVLRAGKAIMGMVGVECGAPRLPATPLSAVEHETLRERLGELNGLARAIVE